MIVLDRIIEDKKATILADAFYLLVSEKIAKKDYYEIVLVVEQIFFDDLEVLKLVGNGNPKNVSVVHISGINRLVATGCIFRNAIDANGMCYNHYSLSNVGKELNDIYRIK